MVPDEQTIPARSWKRSAAVESGQRTNSFRRSGAAKRVPYLSCSQLARRWFGEGADQYCKTRLRWNG